ncbi:MAG TPA: TonB C-terminal domain-containing protein [Allosphingosinicella sp.]|nr:TonB C-terminal domain-containing protein [Allosphingosinicella sp.]
MDRAEATGMGVATMGHAALLAALTLGFANAVRPPVVNQPIEVSFVEDVGLESLAPTPSEAEPAPKLAEVEGPVEPAEPPPLPEPEPLPQPKAEPVPAPAPAPKPAERPRPPPKAAPAKAKAAPKKASPPKKAAERATGRLSGILSGLSDRESPSRSTTPPARKAGAAVQASLAAEVRRQLKPHWRSPSGADVELLRTIVEVRLSRDGSIVGAPRVLDQTGVNASNSSQAELHRESAVKAVRLAAPFDLPPDYYDAWKVIRPTFDKRLSQ